MLKLVSLICLMTLFITTQSQEYDEMTHDEVLSESQLCGESNFFESECLEKPNCVFMHWHLKSLNEALRLCMSYNEIMKYYVKNPVEYLHGLGAKNHKTITKSNFCDVIDDDPHFYEQKGHIKLCTISTV